MNCLGPRPDDSITQWLLGSIELNQIRRNQLIEFHPLTNGWYRPMVGRYQKQLAVLIDVCVKACHVQFSANQKKKDIYNVFSSGLPCKTAQCYPHGAGAMADMWCLNVAGLWDSRQRLA